MEKITDEALVKWLKNYNIAIKKVSQRLDELTAGGFYPDSPEVKSMIQKLQQYEENLGSDSRELGAIKSALELAEKRAQDAEDLANAVANAAEDASSLANTAKDAAQKALSGESEWGQSVQESIGSLSEESGVLSGKVAELSETSDGLTAKVSSFEGEMDQLTKDGGTIDSLRGSISSVSQKADSHESRVSKVEDGVSTNASSIKQLADNITLQLVDTSGNVLTQIKMEDYKIKLTGDVLADTLTVAQLFSRDIMVSGSFEINNDNYYLGPNFSVLYPDGSTGSYDLAIHAADGGTNTYLGFGKRGISLVSSNSVSIETGLSGGLELNGNTWSSGVWTPTMNNVASYTLQDGRWAALGDVHLVSFRLKGTFDENTGFPLTISGCPVKPESDYAAGGGHLSGYHAGDNVVFAGWRMNASGEIIASGQWATVKDTSRYTDRIYPKSGAQFDLAGTIAF